MRTLLSSSRGGTLVEIVAVLVLMGVMITLASPSVAGLLRQNRLVNVVTQLRGDLNYARMHAVNAGERVEVRFDPPAALSCIREYQVVVRSVPERVIKRIVVDDVGFGVCLAHNNANALVFNSRGIPSGVVARTFTASLGMSSRTLTLSQAGRLVLSQ